MPQEVRDLTPDANALDKLSQFEAEIAAEDKAAGTPSSDTQSAGDRAPASQEPSQGTPDSTIQTGIPSAEEKQAIETAKAEADKEGKELDVDDKGTPKRDAQGKFIKRDKAPVEPPITLTADEQAKFEKWQLQQAQGKYAKDNIRKDRSWKALNAEKEAFNAEKIKQQQALQGAINKFNADVAKHQAEIAATRHNPEKFDELANKLDTEAKLKEAEIIKAENAGDLDAAKKLYAEAEVCKADAGKARKYADQLRKNPPPNEKQVQEKFKADQSTWVAKANTDFPEFAKQGSAVRNAAIESFKEITTADPALARLPGLIYHCVRYAAAKTAADRVPAMEKELGELRTKVKELEVLTNPTPQGGVNRPQTGSKPFEQMTEDEQYNQLLQEAAGLKR
jgi:hypothetical protein